MTQTGAVTALEELIAQGVIKSFETNLESRKRTEPFRVLIHVEDGDYLWRERLWLRVQRALEPMGEKVVVEITYHSPILGRG